MGDPLSYPVDPAGFLDPAAVDLGAFRRKIASMKHLFRSCDEVKFELGDVHRCFDVLRAEAFVAGTRDAYERDPASSAPIRGLISKSVPR